MPTVSTRTQQPEHSHLVDIADNSLSSFDRIASAAQSKLREGNSLDATSLASVNTMTAQAAIATLSGISDDLRNDYIQLCKEPAIARLLLRDEDGREKVYYIARAGSPLPPGGPETVANYRSPIGRLASLPVGSECDVPTGSGVRVYEIIERTVLHPRYEEANWDSAETAVYISGFRPVTIPSLRGYLGPPTDEQEIDQLAVLFEEERKGTLVIEGLRRTAITKMGLRDQPLLNQYQDEIFRLPLDSRIVILGPPGTGKTTTLIKRLGLKLDLQHLESSERILLERTNVGEAGHPKNWLMFTPTELLRQYVREAFNREGIAAPDDRIWTWDDFRRDFARHQLKILRTGATGKGLIVRDELGVFQPATIAQLIELHRDFDKWQKALFWSELAAEADKLSQDGNVEIRRLGVRLKDAVRRSAEEAPASFLAIAEVADQLQSFIDKMNTETNTSIREAFSKHLRQDPKLLDRLVAFLSTLTEDPDDQEEADPEEEDDARHIRGSREAAFEAYTRAMRVMALAQAAKRSIGKQTRNGRIAEWLGDRAMSVEDLRGIGAALQTLTAARRFLNPMRRFLGGTSQRYLRFRRERQGEGRWYRPEAIDRNQIAPLELDTILLSIIRGARELLRDGDISRLVDQPRYSSLKSVQDAFRNQIVVDEATDFSPVQLSCMAGLCDPALDSFFACGDFNQRITEWGSRSAADLKFVHSNIDIRHINVSYRHSRQLNELAHRIALLSDPEAPIVELPQDVDNEGVNPVLGTNLVKCDDIVNWLASRIIEIENFTTNLPSLAVLVNNEADVEPIAKALDAALADTNIRAKPCVRGQTVGQENDVRVFDVQHIKGLEFEGVFFVGIDRLAETNPGLFDKYLYVGATRAAYYLGLTVGTGGLPEQLSSLTDAFQGKWP